MIACEGKATEPGYFEGIRISRRLPTVQVIVVPHAGTDPVTIVLAAHAAQDALKAERRWQAGDSAWAVFDGDEHRVSNPDNWARAIALARSRHIGLAVSNPCFELWYLLHLQDQTAEIHRNGVVQRVRGILKSYHKADALYPELEGRTDEAIARARHLCQRAQERGTDEFCNPTTGVSELVDLLLKLKSSS